MSDRSRERTGKHASIAGDEADQVVRSLIQQFSDPYAFIRELIQNSLDAGAVRIDVDMVWERDNLVITVHDDGEGMDRETIEGYLLVKFRSTKEKDLTKIGKFGIGFVSLFALEPSRVVVDTGRDGQWHRVEFAADLGYTLSRMDDPFEGTTVAITLPRGRVDAQTDAERVRDRAERWCRFADADIRTSARGVANGWEGEAIAGVFGVEAPVSVRDESDGFIAVIGPAAGVPHVGFYNRGLTLLEQEARIVPGVTFRVDDRRLEHTLTRDNVIRDAEFERVIARIRASAATLLGDALHLEAGQAARSGDLARVRALWNAIVDDAPWRWRSDRPILPAIGREPVSLGMILGGLLGSLLGTAETWVGLPGDPLAIGAAAGGTIVVAGAMDDPHVAFLMRRGAVMVPVEARLRLAVAVPAGPDGGGALADAVSALLGTVEVRFALLYGRAGAFAFVSDDPFTVSAVGTPARGGYTATTQVRVTWPPLSSSSSKDCTSPGASTRTLWTAARSTGPDRGRRLSPRRPVPLRSVEGGADPLAPPYDVREVLDEIGRDVLAGGIRQGGAARPPPTGDGRATRTRRPRQPHTEGPGRGPAQGRPGGDPRPGPGRPRPGAGDRGDALAGVDTDDARLAEMDLARCPTTSPARCARSTRTSGGPPRLRRPTNRSPRCSQREVMDAQFAGMNGCSRTATPRRWRRSRHARRPQPAARRAREGRGHPDAFREFMDKHGGLSPRAPAGRRRADPAPSPGRQAAAARMMGSFTPSSVSSSRSS